MKQTQLMNFCSHKWTPKQKASLIPSTAKGPPQTPRVWNFQESCFPSVRWVRWAFALPCWNVSGTCSTPPGCGWSPVWNKAKQNPISTRFEMRYIIYQWQQSLLTWTGRLPAHTLLALVQINLWIPVAPGTYRAKLWQNGNDYSPEGLKHRNDNGLFGEYGAKAVFFMWLSSQWDPWS